MQILHSKKIYIKKVHEYLEGSQFHLHEFLVVISSEAIAYYIHPAESVD